MVPHNRCAAVAPSTDCRVRRHQERNREIMEAMNDKDETVAVMVCGHGSRDTDAIREFELVAAGIKARLPRYDVETGYLEFARPMIRDGLDALTARGAKRILALPGMLFAATHVKNDLPWELNTFMAENPGVEARFGRDLAIAAKLLDAAAGRIASAELAARRAAARGERLLAVVGQGTDDPA